MKEKVRLATGHPHAFHRASTIAAMNNGYFQEEGLPEIELRATGDCPSTITSLKSGTLDFGLDVKTGLVLQENARGEELYIVAGMLNHLDLTLVGAPGIACLADLRGKKIGVLETGSGKGVPWIKMLLRKAGMDPDRDVTWVLDSGYTSLHFQEPRLKRGDYQATLLSAHHKRPELFELIRRAGLNHLAEHADTHPDGLPERVVATSGKNLRTYPEMVKGVLKGIVRGYRFARDPANAGTLRELYRSADWGQEGFGWGKFDESLFEGMVGSSRTLPPDGGISISGLDMLIDEEKAAGTLPENFVKEQAIRFEPLEAAVHELNARFGPEGYTVRGGI